MSSFLDRLDENRHADPRYQEILKLDKMLDDAGIQHTLERLYDGWKIAIKCRDGIQVSDVVEHYGSYGCHLDTMEMMGLVEPDDVRGYMTAQEAFEVWGKYLYENGAISKAIVD